MKTKYSILFFSLIIFSLFGYWVKCQTGTNFSKSISLSNIEPFNYLQGNDVISVPVPGTVLYDSFKTRSIVSNWNLWMREEGKVTVGYDSHGINNSRCLVVKNNGTKRWAYSHNKYVEVLEGDVFSFEGFVKIQGDIISAYACIATYDKFKKPIKWNYISEKVDTKGQWIKVENRFAVPNNINYIRFRLSGIGIGEFKFDNINFRKETLIGSE